MRDLIQLCNGLWPDEWVQACPDIQNEQMLVLDDMVVDDISWILSQVQFGVKLKEKWILLALGMIGMKV